MTTRTIRTLTILATGLGTSFLGRANGIADMSGTTFTQQLHSNSSNSSMLPIFVILMLGALLVVTLMRQNTRGTSSGDGLSFDAALETIHEAEQNS